MSPITVASLLDTSLLGQPLCLTNKNISLKPLLVLAMLFLASCDGASRELKLLKSDPIAALNLTSADVVARTEHDRTNTFGKPGRVLISTRYKPKSGETVDSVIKEAALLVERNGWKIKRNSNTSFYSDREAGNTVKSVRIFRGLDNEIVVFEFDIKLLKIE